MRLSKDMKGKIISAMVTMKYSDADESIKARTRELTTETYDRIYLIGNRNMMDRLPSEYFQQVSTFYYKNPGTDANTQMYRITLHAPTPFKVGAIDYHGIKCDIPELCIKALGIDQASDNIINMKNELRRQLRNLLEPINTLKQLLEVWPEGEEFLKTMNIKLQPKVNLPAVQKGAIQALLS